MRSPVGQPVRLVDYRVPDYLVDRVEMDISLDRAGDAGRRRAVVAPEPAGPGRRAAAARRRRAVAAARRTRRRARSPPSAFAASADELTLAAPPRRPFKLNIETRLAPAANTKLMGLYRSGSAYCTQCEAEGFRRITYFLDRPDVLSVYRVRLEADKAEAPVLLANGNLESSGDAGAGPPLRGLVRSVPKTLLPLRPRRRRSGEVSPTISSPRRGGASSSASIPSRAGEARAAYAMDALKRSMAWDETRLRPRIRSRRVQHRRRLRLQYGGDGEQGAQRLQRQIRARLRRRPRPTTITPASRASSRTNISTTGPATASPAATGSSFA